jgi:hypothetical protein
MLRIADLMGAVDCHVNLGAGHHRHTRSDRQPSPENKYIRQLWKGPHHAFAGDLKIVPCFPQKHSQKSVDGRKNCVDRGGANL